MGNDISLKRRKNLTEIETTAKRKNNREKLLGNRKETRASGKRKNLSSSPGFPTLPGSDLAVLPAELLAA